MTKIGASSAVYPTQAKKRLEWGTQRLRGDEEEKQQVPPLRYPDFLSNLVALANFMRLSLRKAAHAAMSSAAWQEIRVRSGRDDDSIARKWPQKRSDEWLLMVPQNCHPDRSVAQWRDLLLLFRFSRRLFSPDIGHPAGNTCFEKILSVA